MKLREAQITDIPQLQEIRNSVKENALSDPSLIDGNTYQEYLGIRGRGWVYGTKTFICGFAVIDLQEKNIWALFVRPGYESLGIGGQLHDCMLEWYFTRFYEPLWLSTSPGTRAESFYRKAGWKETGPYGKNELKFEISKTQWKKWTDKT